MVLGFVLLGALTGCSTTQTGPSWTEKLMAHPEFKDAAMAAPAFTKAALGAIADLEATR